MQVTKYPFAVPPDLSARPLAEPEALQPSAVPAPDAEARGLSETQLTLIKRAISFCFLVYQPLDVVKQQLELFKFRDLHPINRRCMQAVCFTDREFAYLVFRGSDSVGDWIYNSAALPWFQPRRHLGFEAGWRCLQGAVTQWLNGLDLPNPALVLTGHSLGGAIAHLAALALAQEGRRISNVVTFGAPKAAFLSSVGTYNRTPANIADKTLGALTFCVVNQRDICARMPPNFLGFRNPGQIILIDKKDQLHVVSEINSVLSDVVDDILNFVAPPPSPLAVPMILQQKLPARAVEVAAGGASVLDSGLRKYFLDLRLVWGRAFPPLLLPFIYIRAVLVTGSAAVDHLSAHYVRAFFGNQRPCFYYAPEVVWWRQLPKLFFLILLGLVVLAGFLGACWLAFISIR